MHEEKAGSISFLLKLSSAPQMTAAGMRLACRLGSWHPRRWPGSTREGSGKGPSLVNQESLSSAEGEVTQVADPKVQTQGGGQKKWPVIPRAGHKASVKEAMIDGSPSKGRSAFLSL